MLISRKLTRMIKRTDQSRPLSDLNRRSPDRRFQILNAARAEVCQLAVLHMVPKPFVRIQVRGIGRKKLDFQPAPRLTKEFLKRFRAMNQSAVPQDDHTMFEMPPQVFEKANDFSGANASFHKHQRQTPQTADTGDGREFGP